ncbi:MAG: hypothetical protein IPK16_27640 [Anaerolineales bacterium]|nr:hypothetical protein [Anaerolineales bacterium]
MSRWRAFYQQHYWFLVLLTLFAGFRLLAVLLFRPGGFIADNSDYDFYYAWGQTIPMGYTTFENLWTAYPPLFAALMLPVFEVSSRIAPWVEPRLFFHLLFGLELLLFEIGNLILMYRLALKLTGTERSAAPGATALPIGGAALIPPVLYALMFAPVYTLLGWFEAMPLFFLLLGLDLLLLTRRWGWVGSAVAAALGFLVKLTPVLLVPIAVRWFGARLSWHAARTEWFDRKSPGNLLRPALYVVVFTVVVVAVGLPLARFNPSLALSSFRVNSIRPPWQSVWALVEGYYGFGLVPVDMRNMQGYVAGGQWETRLPWGLITVVFAAIFLWLYTRRYDWTRVRTPIAFAGVSVIWLFLYSKGWSPQFAVWIIAFLVLLQPNLRGVLIALTLTILNAVEAGVFLILLPDEHWIMVATVLLRTLLLLIIAMEWLGQIWPAERGMHRLGAWSRWGSVAVMAATVLALVIGAPTAAQAYSARRLAEHLCRPLVENLRGQATGAAQVIATNQLEVWRDLYPWLYADYDVRVLDSYDPNDRSADVVIGEKLAALTAQGEFWWVEYAANQPDAAWSAPAGAFFAQPGIQLLDEHTAGLCRAARVVRLAEGDVAVAETPGARIRLRQAHSGAYRPGAPLALTLYWQTDAPVGASYTVFTQLLDAQGKLVAQQDNLPVQGLAPTNTWKPGIVLRDPYLLRPPADLPKGEYQLQVGLYDTNGRQPLTLPDGTKSDHVTFPVVVN